MIVRAAFSVLALLAIVDGAPLVGFVFAVIPIFLYPFFVEGIVISLVIDLLFGVPGSIHPLIPFPAATVALALFLGVLSLRGRTRLFAR